MITTTLDRISAKINNYHSELTKYYGKEVKDWKPFENQTISDIIEEYLGKTNLNVSIKSYIIDCFSEIKDEKTWAYLKLLRSNSILIVDSMALLFKENQDIAKVFDDYAIGGCLIPINLKLPNELQKIVKENSNLTLKHLHIYIEDFPEKGFVYIELDRINRKNDLIRAITNIATTHLGIKERKINNLNIGRIQNFNLNNLLG